jgi:hypothetical protein
MPKIVKHIIVLLLVASVVVLPCATGVWARDEINPQAKEPINENTPGAGAMTADALLLRPLGLVAMVGGLCLFIISSPFSAMGGNTDMAVENLITAPAEFTLQRPLGEF